MKINISNIKNPYLLAFIKAFNIPNGAEVTTYKYMFWIDEKHTEYRKMHNLPDHIILNDAQVKDFCQFIDL